MLCYVVRRLIQAYLGGALRADDAERLRGHCERCAACAAALRQAQGAARLVASLPRYSLSPQEIDAVRVRVRARSQERLGARLLGTDAPMPLPARPMSQRAGERWDALRHSLAVLGFRAFSRPGLLPAYAAAPIAAALLLLFHQGVPRPEDTARAPVAADAPAATRSEGTSRPLSPAMPGANRAKDGIEAMAPESRARDAAQPGEGAGAAVPSVVDVLAPTRTPAGPLGAPLTRTRGTSTAAGPPVPADPRVPVRGPAASQPPVAGVEAVPTAGIPGTAANGGSVDEGVGAPGAAAEASREAPAPRMERGVPPVEPREVAVLQPAAAPAPPVRAPAAQKAGGTGFGGNVGQAGFGGGGFGSGQQSRSAPDERHADRAVEQRQSVAEAAAPVAEGMGSQRRDQSRAQYRMQAGAHAPDTTETAAAPAQSQAGGFAQAPASPAVPVAQAPGQGAGSRVAFPPEAAGPAQRAGVLRPGPRAGASPGRFAARGTADLIALLASPAADAREAALELGRRRERAGVTALARALKEHADAGVRQTAADALGAIRSPEAIAALRAAAAGGDPGRAPARRALERLRIPPAP